MEENEYIEIQKAGNRNPFNLPENYFEEFAARMDEMAADTPKEVKRFIIRPWMYGAAASLAGVLLMGQVYLSDNKKQKLASETYDTYVLSQVNESSIIDYYLASETEK